ncbi:UDP-glucose 4-epimerase GalE [Paraflavisolibacter sp. H34]|uniref:UDP-glucose 4-epimerase GalE n=1 Tax=Huijunlia imazamoxiresistens TaxID=3127457 RepID=UPI00301599BE
MKEQTVMVTGGLGYIGSHTVVELQQKGSTVVIVDNLSNSEAFILDRIEAITSVRPVFYRADAGDAATLRRIFQRHRPEVVIHFAAHKSVGESVAQPLNYFRNNLGSLLGVLEAMEAGGTSKLIFSSSATVYGQPGALPLTETSPFRPALSAYGSTKQMGEEVLEKVCAAGGIRSISLRYFNPVGAHPSALIGELPRGIPNNLFPYVTQTGIGKLPQLTVHGADYDTADGSCLRDYIHVVDLARAHVRACERLLEGSGPAGNEVFNIGTGRGTTVLEVIRAFEQCAGRPLNYRIGPRRPGDAAAVYADTQRARQVLGWQAGHQLPDMIRSAWKWEQALAAKQPEAEGAAKETGLFS